MEGYCLKCKAKKEMKEANEITMKNGRKAMKGKCYNASLNSDHWLRYKNGV